MNTLVLDGRGKFIPLLRLPIVIIVKSMRYDDSIWYKLLACDRVANAIC